MKPFPILIKKPGVRIRSITNKIIEIILRYTLACVFLFVFIPGIAQDCSSVLDDAKSKFDQGHLNEIIGLMDDCLEGNDLSNAQKIEGYEILALTYLYIDSLDRADEMYLKLLEQDYEWKPQVDTEVEIKYLSNNFITTPIFTIYPMKIGGNYTFIQQINANGVDNVTNSNQSYRSRFGFQIGAGGDWNINRDLSLAGEIWFVSKNYQYRNNLFANPATAVGGATPGDSLLINYNAIGFDVPIYLRYTKQFNKWHPFVYGGYIFHYNLDYSAKPEYYDINGTGTTQIVNPDVGQTLNISSIRNNINHSVTAGAGIKYRIKLARGYRYFLFEVRYAWGLKNVLNTDKQFDFKVGDNQDPVREYTFKYSQVDDDFRMNQIYFNLGFVYPIYKARKKGTKIKSGKKKKGEVDE